MFSLIPNATDFEMQNAIHLAYLSELAYQNEYYIAQKIENNMLIFNF